MMGSRGIGQHRQMRGTRGHHEQMERMHRSLSPAERERMHQDCHTMMGLDGGEALAR